MRTVVNTIERLSDDYECRVITRNHDGRGDTRPYEGVKTGEWNQVGSSMVYYLGTAESGSGTLARLVDEFNPDLVYLNSLFSTLSFSFLHFNKRRPSPRAALLAPCGELAPEAISSKRIKKHLYILFNRLMGAFKCLIWKASTDEERFQIAAAIGDSSEILVARDLPAHYAGRLVNRVHAKLKGRVRLAFISRIEPVKNLDFLIRAVSEAGEGVSLDVFGDTVDRGYFRKCERARDRSKTINFFPSLPHSEVVQTLNNYDFLAVPSRSENFSHIILEAQAAGVPVLVSDRTPWNQIEDKGSGFVLALQLDKWVSRLKQCLEMEAGTYSEMCVASQSVASGFLSDPSIEMETRRAIGVAIQRGGCSR